MAQKVGCGEETIEGSYEGNREGFNEVDEITSRACRAAFERELSSSGRIASD